MSRKLWGALLSFTTVPHCTSESSRGGICSCHSKGLPPLSHPAGARKRSPTDHSLETQVSHIRAFFYSSFLCFIFQLQLVWYVCSVGKKKERKRRRKKERSEQERKMPATCLPIVLSLFAFSPIMQICTFQDWNTKGRIFFFLFLSGRIWFSACSHAAVVVFFFFLSRPGD